MKIKTFLKLSMFILFYNTTLAQPEIPVNKDKIVSLKIKEIVEKKI